MKNPSNARGRMTARKPLNPPTIMRFYRIAVGTEQSTPDGVSPALASYLLAVALEAIPDEPIPRTLTAPEWERTVRCFRERPWERTT
jgi:hypothetical protein